MTFDATESDRIRNELQIESDRTRNDDQLNVGIASRIAQLLENAGLKPAELARQLDINKSNLSRLLKGQTAWTPKHLQGVATALGVHPRELLPDPNDATAAPRLPNPPPLSLTDAETALVLAVRTGNLRLVAHYLTELAPETPPAPPPAPKKENP